MMMRKLFFLAACWATPCRGFSSSLLSQSRAFRLFYNHVHAKKSCLPASAKRPVRVYAEPIANSDDGESATAEKKPTIAIVGSGAVGCYYGARLYETGLYDVKFFMRNENFEASKRDGLSVTSVAGDVFIPPESLQVYDSTFAMGTVDWVIIALKSTSLEAAPSLVRPLLRSDTRVLAIMNGLIDEDLVDMLENSHKPPAGVAASPFNLKSCAAVYGGMALVCSNRIGPGKVDHSYAGKLTGALAASSSDAYNQEGNQDVDRKALVDLWRPTSIEFVYDEDLVRGRWTKNVWNLPFNGISVAMGGITVDKIVLDRGLRRLADIVMDEAIAVGNADLEARGADPSTFLGQEEKDQMMTLSDNMGPYKPSTMLDFHARNPMEVKYLFRKAVDRANKLNVPVPHLETLVTQIEAFQRMYNLY